MGVIWDRWNAIDRIEYERNEGTVAKEKRAMQQIRVAELFAGVGGFRLALDGYAATEDATFQRDAAGPFKTVWANPWEHPGRDA